MFQDISECEKELSYMRERLLVKQKTRDEEKALEKFSLQYQTDIEPLYVIFSNILINKGYTEIPSYRNFTYIMFKMWDFKRV